MKCLYIYGILFSFEEQIFGCPLDSLCEREQVYVPLFVQLCLSQIEKLGIYYNFAKVDCITMFDVSTVDCCLLIAIIIAPSLNCIHYCFRLR